MAEFKLNVDVKFPSLMIRQLIHQDTERLNKHKADV